METSISSAVRRTTQSTNHEVEIKGTNPTGLTGVNTFIFAGWILNVFCDGMQDGICKMTILVVTQRRLIKH